MIRLLLKMLKGTVQGFFGLKHEPLNARVSGYLDLKFISFSLLAWKTLKSAIGETITFLSDQSL